MSQAQLDRIENILTTLVKTVGTMMEDQTVMKTDIKSLKENQGVMKADIKTLKEEQSVMKADIKSLKEEQTAIKEDIAIMRMENEKQFAKINQTLHYMKADHDLAWEKVHQHDREIGILKKFNEN